MEAMTVILALTGTLVSILLSIVAYFLKILHADVRNLVQGFQSLAIKLNDSENKGRAGYREMTARFAETDRRITHLEKKILQ